MSEAATIVDDPAVARAERRLTRLERLTVIGMELAEALLDRAMRPAPAEAGSATPSAPLTQLSSTPSCPAPSG